MGEIYIFSHASLYLWLTHARIFFKTFSNGRLSLSNISTDERRWDLHKRLKLILRLPKDKAGHQQHNNNSKSNTTVHTHTINCFDWHSINLKFECCHCYYFYYCCSMLTTWKKKKIGTIRQSFLLFDNI